MDYRTLHAKTVADLRAMARAEKIKIPAGASKAQIVELLLEVENARATDMVQKQAQAQRAAEEKLMQRQQERAEILPAEEPVKRKRGRPPKAKPAAPVEIISEKTPEMPVMAPVADIPDVQPEQTPETAARIVPEAAVPQSESAVQTAPGNAVPPSEAAPQYAPRVNRPYEPRRNYDDRRSFQQPQGNYEPRRYYDNDNRRNGEYRPNYDQNRANYDANRPNYEPNRPYYDQNSRAYGEQNRQNYEPSRPYYDPNSYQPRSNMEQNRPQQRYVRREFTQQDPSEVSQSVSDMLANGECAMGSGVLEIMPDGYGFLRAENCQNGPKDVYVSNAQIRRFNLRPGDFVVGKTRAQREGDRLTGLLFIDSVNGDTPDKAIRRPRFDDLTPVYPNQRIRLEAKEGKSDMALRVIDMLAPIGRGQRALIVSQPKAGKTVLLKKIANAITENAKDITLLVLLIDERPEEVTDMQRSIAGEVLYSTFDEVPENHVKVAEMVSERAQRLVEQGKDVVILLDSITRLARAYNLVVPPSGRTLSGGLDPGALHKPKRFFGAARNIENGGSLTIIATALVETGSRMDDIIFEEFKGTGNSEIHLDRKLSEKRIFPAIDMNKSGTRRDDLLLNEKEMEGALAVRRTLSGGSNQDAVEDLLSMLEKTETNEQFFQRMKTWQSVLEKDGYSQSGR